MNTKLTPKKLVTLLMIALPSMALTACNGGAMSSDAMPVFLGTSPDNASSDSLDTSTPDTVKPEAGSHTGTGTAKPEADSDDKNKGDEAGTGDSSDTNPSEPQPEPEPEQTEPTLTPTKATEERATEVYSAEKPSSLTCSPRADANKCTVVSLTEEQENPLDAIKSAFDGLEAKDTSQRFSKSPALAVTGTLNAPDQSWNQEAKAGLVTYVAADVRLKDINIDHGNSFYLLNAQVDADVNIQETGALTGYAHLKKNLHNQGLFKIEVPASSDKAVTIPVSAFGKPKAQLEADEKAGVSIAAVGMFINGTYTQDGSASVLHYKNKTPFYADGLITLKDGMIYLENFGAPKFGSSTEPRKEVVLMSSTGVHGKVRVIYGSQAPKKSNLGKYKAILFEQPDPITFTYKGEAVMALALPTYQTTLSDISLGKGFLKMPHYTPTCGHPQYDCGNGVVDTSSTPAEVEQAIQSTSENAGDSEGAQQMQKVFTSNISGDQDLVVENTAQIGSINDKYLYHKTVGFTGNINLSGHKLSVRQNAMMYAFNNTIDADIELTTSDKVSVDGEHFFPGIFYATNTNAKTIKNDKGWVYILGSLFYNSENGYANRITEKRASLSSLMYNFKAGTSGSAGAVYWADTGISGGKYKLPLVSYPISLTVSGNFTQGDEGTLVLNNGSLYVKGKATLDGTLQANYAIPTTGAYYAAAVWSDHEINGEFLTLNYYNESGNSVDASESQEHLSVKLGDKTIYTLVYLIGDKPAAPEDSTMEVRPRAAAVVVRKASNLDALSAMSLGTRDQVGYTQSGRAVHFAMPVYSALAELRDTLLQTQNDALEGREFVNAQRVNTRTRLMLSNNNWFGLFNAVAKPTVRFDAGVILGSGQRLSHVEQLQVAARLGQAQVQASLSYVGSRFNGAYKDKDNDTVKNDRLSTSSTFGLDLGVAQMLPQAHDLRLSAQASLYHFSNRLVRENVDSADTYNVDSKRLSFQLDLGVSKDFALGSTQLTPFIGYRVALLKQDKVSEKLMNAELTIKDQSRVHNSVLAGVNAQWHNAFAQQGLGLTAGAAVAYRFNESQLEAQLADSSDSLKLPFTDDVRFSGYVQGGLNYNFGPLSAGVNAQLLFNGSVDTALKANVNYSF